MTYQVRTKSAGSFTDFLVVRDDELSSIRFDSMAEAAWLEYILNHVPEGIMDDACKYAVEKSMEYLK